MNYLSVFLGMPFARPRLIDIKWRDITDRVTNFSLSCSALNMFRLSRAHGDAS